MRRGILFLTLNVFSATGGIEKVSRIAGKALNEISDDVEIYSMHDKASDANDRYFRLERFKAFDADKIKFVSSSLAAGRGKKTVILSHINLLAVGYLIKMAYPGTQLLLLTHGIEVWKKFSWLKRKMLNSCDLILPVSRFTKQRMLQLNNLDASQFRVLNNCLDPFLHKPSGVEKSRTLLKKYGFTPGDTILMTLSRMSSAERYKGYDKVLVAMKELNVENLHYMIIGKYDSEEKARLDKLISDLGLADKVVFTGFVSDEELADHFNLADVYVMPSEKEGFGIVFIEAMYYGKPVIAGNRDGSTDALDNGRLGTLVDPNDPAELSRAIAKIINSKASFIPDRDKVDQKFSYDQYKKNLERIINETA